MILRSKNDQRPPGTIPGRLLQNALPLFTSVLAILAVIAPLTHGDAQARIGFLLVITALLEMTHGFRRATSAGQVAAWFSGSISLILGLLLLNAPFLAAQALRIFIAGWFGLDGVRYLMTAIRGTVSTGPWFRNLLPGLGNLLLAVVVLLLGEHWLTLTMGFAAAFRIFNIAWTMATSPVLTAENLATANFFTPGMPQDSRVLEIAERIAGDETARVAIDRGWIFSFLLTLLAIHVGRMGFDRTILGLMSPGFAVIGDMFAALLMAFLVVIPAMVIANRLTRRVEGAAWLWCVQADSDKRGWARRGLQSMLMFRLRHLIRLRQARCSYMTALSRGLQIGLPLAAIIAATTPVWGMSWYFDTENWAAGIWNSWAEHRTDEWRTAMVQAVSVQQNLSDLPADKRFAVAPAGIQPGEDFSFIVIGDPGEGDASQLSLKSQFLEVVKQDDVRFVVISSDVVYPTGSMKDYEAKFWLPFMGTRKPVYAIPGNHDWYDALECFAATFFEPDAARAAIRARVDADNRISGTTDDRIHELIAQATHLQAEYQIPTQLQQAPYFQLQTESFALFAVDTGVARRLDDDQRAWLEAALEAAGDKGKMVILGHPFFAGGVDRSAGAEDKDFVALRTLFRKHNVSVVMAGDTHDLEYYRENGEQLEGEAVARSNHATHMTHHFVNGGGGAYLSFGTALDWPATPVTSEWAFFPNSATVVSKIQATIPLWKRPAWFWTQQFGGWPFSKEWLSAAFDVNEAPFYQSFVEVRVEPSMNRLRLIPYGVHGQLRYQDLQMSSGMIGPDHTATAGVEWIIPLPSGQ